MMQNHDTLLLLLALFVLQVPCNVIFACTMMTEKYLQVQRIAIVYLSYDSPAPI